MIGLLVLLGAAPIIDSAKTRAEALDGVSPDCPATIADAQTLLDVRYTSMDGALHQGQIVVNQAYAAEVASVFAEIERLGFPVRSVVPISAYRWDDNASMAADNTSSFNYRKKTGGGTLSLHACGAAIDLNPRLNPYVTAQKILPVGAMWDPTVPGTLTADHPVTRAFRALGWRWGGTFKSVKDYQHFEKDCPS